MHHNELKRGKKTILAGQCTVCFKGQNQHFLKFFLVEGPRREPGVKKKFQKTLILAFEANSSALSCQNGLFSAF